MLRPTARLSIRLCVICALLMFAVQLWGRVLSPGAMLAYLTQTNSLFQLHVLDLRSRLRVDLGFVFNESPAWSLDGRLAFASFHDDGTTIYVWDGATLTNVSQVVADNVNPAWSADGRLAFASTRNHMGEIGRYEIYVWDGTMLTNISQNAAYDYNPSWGADGRLVFVSERDGNDEIYVWDGVSLTNLTYNPTKNDSAPALWTP